MYANRFESDRRLNPASLGVALGLNAAVVAALILAAPPAVLRHPPRILEVFRVAPEPPPPDPVPLPQPVRQTRVMPRRVDTPPRTVETRVTPTTLTRADTHDPIPPVTTLSGTGGGDAIDLPRAEPVFVASTVDPRHAADFQPVYPPEERRAQREGVVTVRVLIGVDGRVREVQPLSATSDAFLRVTVDRARRAWRFRPATRDGIPVESWRQMTLTFVLRD